MYKTIPRTLINFFEHRLVVKSTPKDETSVSSIQTASVKKGFDPFLNNLIADLSTQMQVYFKKISRLLSNWSINTFNENEE